MGVIERLSDAGPLSSMGGERQGEEVRTAYAGGYLLP
jgi:hypothetical protein